MHRDTRFRPHEFWHAGVTLRFLVSKSFVTPNTRHGTVIKSRLHLHGTKDVVRRCTRSRTPASSFSFVTDFGRIFLRQNVIIYERTQQRGTFYLPYSHQAMMKLADRTRHTRCFAQQLRINVRGAHAICHLRSTENKRQTPPQPTEISQRPGDEKQQNHAGSWRKRARKQSKLAPPSPPPLPTRRPMGHVAASGGRKHAT